jgi:hypothetical protein
MLATSRECHGNTLGTTKIQQPHPPQKEEKKTPQSVIIGCMKFLFAKLFVTIFNLD